MASQCHNVVKEVEPGERIPVDLNPRTPYEFVEERGLHF